MCLSSIEHFQKSFKEGYMVRRIFNFDGLLCIKSLYQGTGKNMPIRKWLDEIDFRKNSNTTKDLMINSIKGNPYRAGWHVFQNLEDAKAYRINQCIKAESRIFKVRCRNSFVRGIQSIRKKKTIHSAPVGVFKEVFLYKHPIKEEEIECV